VFLRVFVILGVDKIYENRGVSTSQLTVRLSAASVEVTLGVCRWREQERARPPATSEGAMKATTFVAISEGLRVKKPRFEQFRLELDVKLAVCEPIVSTAKRHRGRGFRQLSAGRRIFWAVGWWRTGDGERWPVCGRFDVKAGQVVSSVLAR
jgi:hypothetical protein